MSARLKKKTRVCVCVRERDQAYRDESVCVCEREREKTPQGASGKKNNPTTEHLISRRAKRRRKEETRHNTSSSSSSSFPISLFHFSPCRPLLRLAVIFSLIYLSLSFAAAEGEADASLCPRSDASFLDELRSECPRWIELRSPPEVDGEFVDQEFSGYDTNGYHSVLFYALWCPFSSNIRPVFDVLSSMFPHITHLLVEESVVMPSILSKYGIHSFPAIILSNQTAIIRYQGPKDYHALIQFYWKVTGLEPITYMVANQPSNPVNVRCSKHGTEFLRELITTEPYVLIAVLFVCLKAMISLLPFVYAHLKAFWLSDMWHLNLHIIVESYQLLPRVLREKGGLWSKLKLGNKTRNLRKGANNARAWASTLTSVSLGESSSRLAPSDL